MIWDSIRWDPIWGQVGFDENGDRQAAYELWNYQPDAWKATRGEKPVFSPTIPSLKTNGIDPWK